MKTKIYLVIILIAVSLALIGTEVFYSKKEEINPVSKITLFLFSPFQELLMKTTPFFHQITRLNSLEAQNRELKSQVTSLQEQIYNLQIEKNHPIIKGPEFNQSLKTQTITAQILLRSPSHWFSEFTINKGAVNGITPNQGIIGAGTAVGKIIQVSPKFSTAAFITNTHVTFPVEILPGNYTGICYGDGKKECIVRYLPLNAVIKPGDQVVTLNIGHIFPVNGIPVGKILKIEADPREAFFKKGIISPYFENRTFFSIQILTGLPTDGTKRKKLK